MASSVQAAPDNLSRALSTVKENTPECKDCLFFGVPIINELANQLIRKHQLFTVSTLDMVPSPIWSVALSSNETPYLLEARDLNGWNQMIQGEQLSLKSQEDFTTYARVFLRLNAPRSLYIPSLTNAEMNRIQSQGKGRKIHKKGVRVIKSKKRVGLAFYAKNVVGNLERWSLLIESGGQVIKAENQVFR